MDKKEHFVIAREDFEAFNPHYDLEKPIKVKKGSVLLVNGGFPCQQLTTMTDNSETLQCSLEGEGYGDIFKVCYANNVAIIDFRTIANTNALKKEFLKPDVVKFPIFYWFEDCDVLPMNLLVTPEGKEYKVVNTFNIFGNPCMLRVAIKESDYCVSDGNGRLIMILDNYFETLIQTAQNLIETLESDYAAKEIVNLCYETFRKSGVNKNTDLPDIQGAYNKFSNDMIKQIEKIQDDRINEILTDIFGGE